MSTTRPNARYTPLDASGPLPRQMVAAVPAIRRDPLGYLERTVARHGDLVAFPLPRGAVLLVNDPQGARRVLQDNHRGYGKATLQYRALGMVTGAGLLTADGEQWRASRRIVQPAFHHHGLDAVAEEAVRAGERLRTRCTAAGPGTAVDVDAAAMQAMLELVGRTLLDADLAEVGRRVVTAVDVALHAVVARARTPVPAWLPTPGRRRLRRAVATLDEICLDLVGRRRSRDPAGGAQAAPDCGRGDLLDLLLRSAQAEGGMSDRQLRDELVTLVIAGHETVASCLTWTLHLLAGAGSVQDLLHAELDRVLAGRAATWADLKTLPYTRAVVDEALRLYPPAWILSRRALADDTICGIEIPAGTLVLVSPWLLHRRRQEWPDPSRFDPQRFLAGTSASARVASPGASSGAPRGDYLPFGAGPRLCIGREFALVEVVLVLATLLRDHRVVPVAGSGPVRVDARVTLRPHGGLPLVLRRRGSD